MPSISKILLCFIKITEKKTQPTIIPKTKEYPEMAIMLIPNVIVQYKVFQHYKSTLLQLFHKLFDLEIN